MEAAEEADTLDVDVGTDEDASEDKTTPAPIVNPRQVSSQT